MACKVRSSEDFKKLENKIGTYNAFKASLQNNMEVPVIQTRQDNYFIRDLKERYNIPEDLSDRPSSYITDLIDKIKQDYIGDYQIITTPEENGPLGFKIEGYPISREEAGFDPIDAVQISKEVEYMEKYGDAETLLLPYTSAEEQKEDTQGSREQRYKEMEAILLKSMPKIKEVIYDETLPVSGQLEANGETIRVNPILMTEDTLGHEFGHLLIDLLGGMNNPLIKSIRKSLEGSKPEARVLEEYPELKDTAKFDKEVIAQAVGEEFVDLFSNTERKDQEEVNSLANMFIRFFRRLRALLGIEKGTARDLAKMLVKGEPLSSDKIKGEPSPYVQQQKGKKTTKKKVVKRKEYKTKKLIKKSPKEQEVSIYIEELDAKITKHSEGIRLSKDGVTYEIPSENIEGLDRVSTVMFEGLGPGEKSYGMSSKDETPVVRRSQRLGTLVHEVLESLQNKDKKLYRTKTEFTISRTGISDLKKILQDAFGDKYHVLTEVKIADPDAKMAGTIDVVAINKKNGKVYLFDYKTAFKKYEDGTPKGFKYYRNPFKGKTSKEETNRMQLSIYKKMFEKQFGVEVAGAAIIPINLNTKKTEGEATFGEDTVSTEIILSAEIDSLLAPTGNLPLSTHPDSTAIYNRRLNLEEETETEEAEVVEENEPQDLTEEELTSRMKEELESDRLETTKELLAQMRSRSLKIVNVQLRRNRMINRNYDTERLKNLAAILRDTSIEDQVAILTFADQAIKTINAIYDNYQDRVEKYKEDRSALDLRTLNRWQTMLTAYDFLDTIVTQLMKEQFNVEGLSRELLDDIDSKIRDAIAKKNVIKMTYLNEAGEIFAEEMHKYDRYEVIMDKQEAKRKAFEELLPEYKAGNITKRELATKIIERANQHIISNIDQIKKKTKKNFRKELITATESDITAMERWVGTALNTKDRLAGSMVVKNSIIDHDIRTKSIDTYNKILVVLEELEDYLGYTQNTKMSDFYSFMIEKDKDGNPTNHFITRIPSSLIKEYDNLKESLAQLEPREYNKKRHEWLNENLPLDKEAKLKDFKEFANQMVKENRLTQEEYNSFFLNYSLPFSKRVPVEDLIKDEEAADDLISWDRYNSFSYRNPTKPNLQWQALQSILKNPNDPRTKFYNLITDIAAEADDLLGGTNRMHSTFPFIRVEGRERMLEGDTVLNTIKDRFKTFFKVRYDDEGYSQVTTDENDKELMFVPIRHRPPANFDIKEQSFDIASLYFEHLTMAYKYRRKSEFAPYVEQGLTLMSERDMVETDFLGRPKQIKLEDGTTINKTKKGATSNLVKQIEAWRNSQIYGQYKKREIKETFGVKYDLGKAVDVLNSITSYNNLALNMHQMASNIGIGEIQTILEASAGTHYDSKGLRKSSSVYRRNLPNMMADIGERAPKNTISKLIRKFNILNDYAGGKFREKSLTSHLMTTNTLYVNSHLGEHMLQTRVMLAMLDKVKAFDKNGKEIGTMLDMYYSKGYDLVLDERVSEKHSRWTQEDQALFGAKVRRVLAFLHGEYNIEALTEAQQESWGRAAFAYRKFVVPNYNKRFQRKRVNFLIEEPVEGYYNATATWLWKMRKEIAGFKFALMSEEWDKLMPEEQKNIARTFKELGFTLALFLTKIGLAAAAGEIDDDDEALKVAVNNMHYVTYRVMTENMFFWNFFSTMEILRSPAAGISTLENMGKLVKMLLNGRGYEVIDKGNWEGHPRAVKQLIKMIPIVRQVYKTANVDDILKVLKYKQ